MFKPLSEIRTFRKQLFKNQYGNKLSAKYALTFIMPVAQRSWNEWALITAYQRALQEELQKELAFSDEALTLNQLISFSIWLDNRLHKRKPHFLNLHFLYLSDSPSKNVWPLFPYV